VMLTHTPVRDPWSIVALILTGAALGFFFSLVKLATSEGVPALSFVFWYAFGAGALNLVYACFRGSPPKWTPRHVRAYFAMAVAWIWLPFITISFVAPKIPAGIVSLIISLVPPFTLVVVLVVRTEKFNLWRLVGMLLGVAGVLLLVIPESSLPSRDMVPWVLLILIAPVGGALGNLWAVTLRPRGCNSAQLASGTLIVGSLALLPVVIGVDGLWIFEGRFSLAHMAVLGSMVVMAAIWYVSLEFAVRSGPVFLSLFDYAGTLAGIGWGMLIFSERHSLWVWGALVLVMASVYIVNRTTQAVQ
jgi:drug/metabolite transporter (DMT)-like permease